MSIQALPPRREMSNNVIFSIEYLYGDRSEWLRCLSEEQLTFVEQQIDKERNEDR
jgi:hypothetical protein